VARVLQLLEIEMIEWYCIKNDDQKENSEGEETSYRITKSGRNAQIKAREMRKAHKRVEEDRQKACAKNTTRKPEQEQIL
jgi:hypothetical protein